MACLRTPLLFLSLLLISCTPCLEARKLLKMEKEKVSTLQDSLVSSALSMGTTPPSSPSGKGHDAAISERLFTLHLAHVDRILQSNPSPGVGH